MLQQDSSLGEKGHKEREKEICDFLRTCLQNVSKKSVKTKHNKNAFQNSGSITYSGDILMNNRK